MIEYRRTSVERFGVLWMDCSVSHQSVKDVVSINKFKQSVKLFLFNQI